jgi:hypothetical protein
MRLPLVLCAGSLGVAALFGISALARESSPAKGTAPVATEQDLENAARHYRIGVYQTFREQRGEFDRRNAELAQRVGAWQRAGKPAGELDALVAWVRETTPGARGQETPISSPVFRVDASPAPATIADKALPTRQDVGGPAPQALTKQEPAVGTDVKVRPAPPESAGLPARKQSALQSDAIRSERGPSVDPKPPANGSLPSAQTRVAMRALPTRPTKDAAKTSSVAASGSGPGDAVLPRVAREASAVPTRGADATALPAVSLHVGSGVAALDRPKTVDASRETAQVAQRTVASATPIDAPATKPLTTSASIKEGPIERIDAQEVAVRVAGFNLALATLEEDAGRRRDISPAELVTLVERLEALATRAEDLRPYFALAGADELAALGRLESAAKVKLTLAAQVAAARTTLEAQSADGVGQVTDQYEQDAEEQLKELARRIDAIRVDG